LILTEGHDTVPGPRDLPVGDDLIALETCGPDLTGHPVAAHVGVAQVWVSFAVVDVSAGDGSRLAVREVERRRQDRSRAALALEPGRLPAFHDRPAIIAAALDAVHHLPGLPAHVANPQVAGRPVEGHFPGVAEAVGPNLGPAAFL